MTSFQLPADATMDRTMRVVQQYEQHLASRPGIDVNQSLLGFSFSGSGPNAAMAYTMLKDWKDRHGATVAKEVELAQAAMASAGEGAIMVVMPPAIDELGNSAGFLAAPADRNQGYAALQAAQTRLLNLAAQSRCWPAPISYRPATASSSRSTARKPRLWACRSAPSPTCWSMRWAPAMSMTSPMRAGCSR
jgi:multidrug efflux pump